MSDPLVLHHVTRDYYTLPILEEHRHLAIRGGTSNY
jgi:hypothetical protein